MRRIIASLFLLFAFPVLLAAQSSSQPKPNWLERQFRDHPIRTRIIATAIAGAVYAEGLHRCRIPNVENCQGHYGAAWGEYGTTMALDGVAQLVGYEISGKTGNSISYGSNLGIIGWGAYQWHGGLNKPSEDPKPDLSQVVIVKH
jgi:hypothetical protein